jgi:hypothetical protein
MTHQRLLTIAIAQKLHPDQNTYFFIHKMMNGWKQSSKNSQKHAANGICGQGGRTLALPSIDAPDQLRNFFCPTSKADIGNSCETR